MGSRTRAWNCSQTELWTQHSKFAAAKCIAHFHTVDYLKEQGAAVHEINLRKEGWTSCVPGTGVMGKAFQSDLAECVCGLLPGFSLEFEEVSTHKYSMRGALIHRSRHSIRNNELKRFRAPSMLPFYNFVKHRYKAQRPIEDWERYQIHEEVITNVLAENEPGVYLSRVPSNPEVAYLGQTKDLRSRPGGHTNAFHWVTKVWVTYNERSSLNLENSIFKMLDKLGLVKAVPKKSKREAGLMILSPSVDVEDVISSIVRDYYQEFCRSTIGFGEVL